MIDMIAILFPSLTKTVRGDDVQSMRADGSGGFPLVSVVDTGAVGPGPQPAPVNLFPATLAGYAVPGETITATPGTWTNTTVQTGQWQRDGVDISGETALTYTAVQADVLVDITYFETATGPGGTETQPSAAAQDAIAGYASDPAHIDIFGAIPETLSPDPTGPFGILPTETVQRMVGLVHGTSGPELVQATITQRPAYQVVAGVRGLAFDGGNDALIHAGTGLASRLAVNWSCEISVTARRAASTQPVWGTALSSNSTPFQRCANIAGSGSVPGASNVRTTIRADNNSSSTCVMTSSRQAVGTTWALRLSLRRTPTDQEITEVQPDSGTNTDSVGSVVTQDRIAMGAFATPTGVTGYINAIIHAVAYWDNGTPTALSVASARALFTHWGMP